MKVLIVEDEMIVARDLSNNLSQVGYRVCGIVTSVEKALKSVAEHEPDVVLIDIILKGPRDGIELARALQGEWNIPFLFITSHADRATVERAKATRPSGYIVKPFTPDEVYAAVEVALINFADNQASRNGHSSQGSGSDNGSGHSRGGRGHGSRDGGAGRGKSRNSRPTTDPKEGLPLRRLENVKEYIEDNLDSELSLAELADVAGMSKYYFSRLFKKSEGLPPYEYVLRRRAEAGKQLLSKTDLSIAQIALKTGFSSQSHFGKHFRRHIGDTPATYRKKFK